MKKKFVIASIIFVVFLLEVAFGVYVAFKRRDEYRARQAAKINSTEAVLGVTSREKPVVMPDVPADDLATDSSIVRYRVDFADVRKYKAKKPSVKKDSLGLVFVNRQRKLAGAKVQSTAPARKPDQSAQNKTATNGEMTIFSPSDDNKSQDASKQKTGSKSFIAKAVPVIKKPFQWLRALGAKLH